LPLFLVPRIVTRHLAHRLSGRALLTAGLFIVCLGLLLFALIVRQRAYLPMVGGMLLTGIGAGLLNGETTKVGMTVIPKERSGMASGVSGTMRFSGLVIGVAALGAILYGKVASEIAGALPELASADRLRLVHDITAGDLSGGSIPGADAIKLKQLALESFASGYQALFLSGALIVLLAAILTWCLVSAAETPPVAAPIADAA
jgi:hypothetical protein